MKSFALNASKKTKSTSVGEIPVDWGVARLGDISIIKSGGTPERNVSAYWKGSIPWVKTGEIDFNTITATSETITEAGLKESSAWLVPKGSVLMAMYGQGKTRGQVAILGIEAAINQACAAIQADSERLDGLYLFFNLQSRYEEIRDLSNTGSQENLNGQVIRALTIPLPPLAEQRKIAAILAIWDEALEKLDTLIEAKERRRKALMQRLLTGSLRFPKSGKTPWRKVRMNTVLTRVFRPIEWSADKPLSLVSVRRRCGGLFRRADVLGSGYKTQDLHDLKADDFLISKRQVVHGAWALVTPEFEGSHVSKEYVILVNAAPDKLHMPFFAWLAQTPRMIRLARVASTGVHIEKLIFDPEVFLRDIIRLPATVAEQEQIAETLDACTAEVRLLRQQRTALDRQKRGLMQRLLTGKLRVTV